MARLRAIQSFVSLLAVTAVVLAGLPSGPANACPTPDGPEAPVVDARPACCSAHCPPPVEPPPVEPPPVEPPPVEPPPDEPPPVERSSDRGPEDDRVPADDCDCTVCPAAQRPPATCGGSLVLLPVVTTGATLLPPPDETPARAVLDGPFHPPRA